MKTIVISDCHGRPELIENVLHHANYHTGKERLVFAGDFLDIGFHPIECIDLLIENKAELLWGNHDLALVLGKHISPQSQYDNNIYDALSSIKSSMKVATNSGNILITHAGLSSMFYKELSTILLDFFNENKALVLADRINKMSLNDLWNRTGPLWYRPTTENLPVSGLRQICGHTPPVWIKQSGINDTNFISADPYCMGSHFESPNRYRYVLIENNSICVMDSESGV
jgi:hypothetical protein